MEISDISTQSICLLLDLDIYLHFHLDWSTSIPAFIHQDPYVYIKIHGFLYLRVDCFSHSWICGFLSFSAAPCGLGIVHDELIVFNPNLKNYLTQLLLDIFGFRLDHCCIVDSAIHFSTLFYNKSSFLWLTLFMMYVCEKWNTCDWTSVNMISCVKPMDIFYFLCGIEIYFCIFTCMLCHVLYQMFIVWLPSASSLHL